MTSPIVIDNVQSAAVWNRSRNTVITNDVLIP